MSLPDCVFERWSPQIGDPTLMGWFTVAAYGVAGLLCLVSFTRSDTPAIRRFGQITGVLLLALMVNKQLDLQSALTASGRCLSQAQGWYEQRRTVQALFVIAVLAGFVMTGGLVFRAMRRYVSQIRLALAGAFFVLTFVTIRAVGFHHIDALFGIPNFNTGLERALELGGIALIAVNAVTFLRLQPRGEER